VHSASQTVDAFKNLTDFQIGEMKFPETKIGEAVLKAEEWIEQKIKQVEISQPQSASQTTAPAPIKVPLPPVIKPTLRFRRERKR